MALYPSTVQSAIPKLWARRLQVALRKILVYADCCNRKYEGELKEIGDQVRIQTVADVSIGSYTRNTAISMQTLTTTDLTLVIDQGKTFGFKWDDLDEVQAVNGITAEAMSRAVYLLRDQMDQQIASTLSSGVSTTTPDNVLPAATSVGTGAGDDDPFEILVDLSAKLDESNVPSQGRWAVVPPWYAGELLKDPRRSSFGTSQNLRAYAEDFMGVDTVSGLRVYRSNNVPVSGSTYTVIAGYDDAATVAEQFNKVDIRPAPDGFFNNHFGALIWGSKVTRPYGLASVAATQAA
jgi:hypothetical protein